MPKTTTPAPLPPSRGRDDVDFLPSRQKTAVADPKVARQETFDFMKRVADVDRATAVEAHEQGTKLNELYASHADRSLGFSSFGAYLAEHWPLDASTAYERMKVARLVTRDQAARYGSSACQIGLRIMATMGIGSFIEFTRTELPLPADEGGGKVRFPAPARKLRAVLRALATPAPGGDVPHAAERVRAYRLAVERATKEDARVEALKPVVWCDRHDAYVRLTLSGPLQAKAASRLVQRLARVK